MKLRRISCILRRIPTKSFERHFTKGLEEILRGFSQTVLQGLLVFWNSSKRIEQGRRNFGQGLGTVPGFHLLQARFLENSMVPPLFKVPVFQLPTFHGPGIKIPRFRKHTSWEDMHRYFLLRRLLSGCEVGSVSLKK